MGALALALTGCGAAYYGAAIGILATQKDTTVTDVSFPDAVPAAEQVPAFATLQLSPTTVTIERDITTFNPTNIAVVATASQTAVPLTDFEVLRVDLQPGYGESLSNRDANTTIVSGDRLIIRVNGDTSRALTFAAADVASIGTTVAAAIEAKVRALTPVSQSVPATAYTLFTVTFDQTLGTYRCRSGAPGETSEVLFEPAIREGNNDAAPDTASGVTAARLGLGRANGGVETSGADATSVVVLNRGTDSIPRGTNIDLWLSHDKVLDPRVDLQIDRFPTDSDIAVGEARRVFRRNGNPPQRRLLRGDFTAGSWYAILDVNTSGGEKVTTNNLLIAVRTVEVYEPVNDPATPAVETAAALDIVPLNTLTPIAAIMGRNLPATLTLTNVGAPVTGGGQAVDAELVLSSDLTFHEPARIVDPTGALAGLRINPTDPSVPVRVVVTAPSATGVLTAAVANGTITVTQGTGSGVASVQSLIDVLNASSGGLVDAFSDGIGGVTTTSVSALLTAAGAGKNDVLARDLLITSKRVTFSPVARPLATQQFVMDGTIRANALKANVLPRKLIPIFRARTVIPVTGGAAGQNARTDIRQALTYVRVYDPAKCTFDATTGALLPTVNTDDFAALDAVTLRPVNTGSLRQGQQRVLRFELPQTGATPDQSQLLVIVRTTTVDTHLDLLGPSGAFITGTTDSALGKDPLVYTPVQAGLGGTSFYVVISPARIDESDLGGGGETFELTISVNARQKGDPALVVGVDAGSHVGQTPQRYASGGPPIVNKTLIPFTLNQSKAEVQFVLQQRARVKFATRPVFSVGVKSTITRFLASQVPTPVSHQQVLDSVLNRLVYRPTGATIDNTHVLEAGAYTFAFETSGLVPDNQALRLEVEAEFIPPD